MNAGMKEKIENQGNISGHSYTQRYTQEQQAVQKGKHRCRSIEEYEQNIFPNRLYKIPSTSPVEKFIDNYCGSTISGLEDLFSNLTTRAGSSVNWVDIGGGLGLAMHQLARFDRVRENVTMTNVDLLEHNIGDLSPEENEFIDVKYPGVIDKATAPRFIKANAETATLPQPADVITSIEVSQYLNNPLAALCNMYNQLTDNGIMIIGAEDRWSKGIRFEGTGDLSPLEPFLSLLQNEQISFAVSDGSYDPILEESYPLFLARKGFRNMVIEKKPGTSMLLRAPVKRILRFRYGYKAVYYEQGGPVVEIGGARPPALDPNYFEQMEDVSSKAEIWL